LSAFFFSTLEGFVKFQAPQNVALSIQLHIKNEALLATQWVNSSDERRTIKSESAINHQQLTINRQGERFFTLPNNG